MIGPDPDARSAQALAGAVLASLLTAGGAVVFLLAAAGVFG